MSAFDGDINAISVQFNVPLGLKAWRAGEVVVRTSGREEEEGRVQGRPGRTHQPPGLRVPTLKQS